MQEPECKILSFFNVSREVVRYFENHFDFNGKPFQLRKSCFGQLTKSLFNPHVLGEMVRYNGTKYQNYPKTIYKIGFTCFLKRQNNRRWVVHYIVLVNLNSGKLGLVQGTLLVIPLLDFASHRNYLMLHTLLIKLSLWSVSFHAWFESEIWFISHIWIRQDFHVKAWEYLIQRSGIIYLFILLLMLDYK